MKESVPRNKGVVDPDFVKKHNLSSKTKPHEYAEIFFPMHPIRQENKNIPDFSFQTMSEYSNIKAGLVDAGPKGSCSPTWTHFTAHEIRQHFGLYIDFHRLLKSL